MAYRQTERSAKIREARRKRILHAARKQFVARGYPDTTMRNIARAAGTSIGNLYFYFGNKDELLATLFRESRAPVWEWISSAGAAEPPGPRRMAIAVHGNILRLLDPDRDLMRLFILKGAPDSLSQGIIDEHAEHWRQLWKVNFPDYPAALVELGLSAWTGVLRRVLDRFVRGEIGDNALAAAEFATAWNLRGAGVAEGDIKDALAAAKRALHSFPSRHR